VPIILVSGLDEDFDLMAGLSAGADDFIQKPVRPQFLRVKLNYVLHKTGAGIHPALPAKADDLAYEEPWLAMDQIIRELVDDGFLSAIEIFYQPVIDLKSGQVIQLEAWRIGIIQRWVMCHRVYLCRLLSSWGR
jgi:DNA-binding response OmpR family regulator